MKESMFQNEGKLGKFGKRLKKIVGIGVLGATLATPMKAKGQESSRSPEISASEVDRVEEEQKSEEVTQETSPDIDKEEYWLNLFKGETMKRFPEYSNKDFAPHLLEQLLTSDPLFFLRNIHDIKTYIGYKDLLREAAEKSIDNIDGCFYLLHEESIEVYKELEDYQLILDKAAKKISEAERADFREVIVYNAPTLFKYLPRTSAEYYLQKGVNAMLEEPDGWNVMLEADIIKKYLPQADTILWKAKETGIQHNAGRFFGELFVDRDHWPKIKKIFTEDEIKTMVSKIITEVPSIVIGFFEEHEKNYPDFMKQIDERCRNLLSQADPTTIDYLKTIAQGDLSYSEKRKVATLIDAMLFDKHLTIEEMKAIVNDPVRAQKLAMEIRSRKNFVGRQSLDRYYPVPKKEASETPVNNTESKKE